MCRGQGFWRHEHYFACYLISLTASLHPCPSSWGIFLLPIIQCESPSLPKPPAVSPDEPFLLWVALAKVFESSSRKAAVQRIHPLAPDSVRAFLLPELCLLWTVWHLLLLSSSSVALHLVSLSSFHLWILAGVTNSLKVPLFAAAFISVATFLSAAPPSKLLRAPYIGSAGCSPRADVLPASLLPGTAIPGQQLASSHGLSCHFLSAASWELVGTLGRNLHYFSLLMADSFIPPIQSFLPSSFLSFPSFDIITHSLRL